MELAEKDRLHGFSEGSFSQAGKRVQNGKRVNKEHIMPHAKIAVMFPKPKKLSQIKDADEKRWKIEDAARTLKRLPEIRREIAQIKADGPLFKAAKDLLRLEIADGKAGLKT